MLQEDDDELGDLWQDQQNMAALLLYKQRGRNQYSLVSICHKHLHWGLLLIEAVRANPTSGMPAIL